MHVLIGTYKIAIFKIGPKSDIKRTIRLEPEPDIWILVT